MDHARRLGRIIHWDHRVIVAAMLLGEGGRRDVRFERSDVPGTDAEDVIHQKRSSCCAGGASGTAPHCSAIAEAMPK